MRVAPPLPCAEPINAFIKKAKSDRIEDEDYLADHMPIRKLYSGEEELARMAAVRFERFEPDRSIVAGMRHATQHRPLIRDAGTAKFASLCAGIPRDELQRPISQLDVQTKWRGAAGIVELRSQEKVMNNKIVDLRHQRKSKYSKLTVRNAIELAMLGIPLVQVREMSGEDVYVFLFKERARGEAAPRKTAAQLRELLTVAPAAAATAAAETGATRGDDSGDSDSGERGKRATATPPQNTHKEKLARR